MIIKIPKLFKWNNYVDIVVLASVFLLGLTPLTTSAKEKSVYGYLEPVVLYPDKIPLIAKLDTGAVTASLSATDIYLYKKNGKRYVKFKVSHPKIEKTLKYDLPVVRIAKIKNRASEEKSESYDPRPVVKMPIYFDGRLYDIAVNLIDRTHFTAPMLLGRKALDKLNAVVDGTTKYTIQ